MPKSAQTTIGLPVLPFKGFPFEFHGRAVPNIVLAMRCARAQGRGNRKKELYGS
jgi:hypothetical protein